MIPPNFLSHALLTGSSLFAYLDPGSGSFALQLLLAGLLSSAYALKYYWRRFREFVPQLIRHHD